MKNSASHLLLGFLLLGMALPSRLPAQPPPEVRDLKGTLHLPTRAPGKTGSVLVFYLEDCPACNGYAPEINRLEEDYTNFDFYIVQVDPDLTAEAAKKHARDYHLQPPVLLDPKHVLVKVAGATVTPEAVVFTTKGELAYRGRIDDLYAKLGTRRQTARKHDLRVALDALAAHRAVPKRETTAIGCLIE